MGFQSLIGKMSPMTLPLFKNTFCLGIAFSLLVTFNPCTIPYLGILVTMFHGPELIIQMILFALGMIAPAILFTLFGQGVLQAIQKKTSKFFHWLNKILAVIMIGSGGYLGWTIHGLTAIDSLVAAFCLIICFTLVVRACTDDPSLKGVVTQKNGVVMLLLLSLLIAGAFSGCYFASMMKYKPKTVEEGGSSVIEEKLKEKGLLEEGAAGDAGSASAKNAANSVISSESASVAVQEFPVLTDASGSFPVAFRPDFDRVHDQHVQSKRRKEKMEKMKKAQTANSAKDSALEESEGADGKWSGLSFHFSPSFVEGIVPPSQLSSLSASSSSISTQFEGDVALSSSSQAVPSYITTFADPSSMSLRPSLSVAFPLVDSSSSPSSFRNNPLSRVTCAAVAPCPGCKWCCCSCLAALVAGIALVMLISPKKIDFTGIVHDTCTLPKFKKDKSAQPRRRRRAYSQEVESEEDKSQESGSGEQQNEMENEDKTEENNAEASDKREKEEEKNEDDVSKEVMRTESSEVNEHEKEIIENERKENNDEEKKGSIGEITNEEAEKGSSLSSQLSHIKTSNSVENNSKESNNAV
eukprot:MONOS_4215.1-p1 / transcript=MONOS_4215.1 / gene=MONOS_4215 / organism=Monocercomonoides_exilis_PA203 / gene_product=unspecified product / transcript_product=unspecified product / location=Mono_scaffold00109:61670-63415(+) / protein_length=582 / sequence_SO=supercontig / SO=protein_coding / is_pseudo=false